MPNIFTFQGMTPVIDPTAFVYPTATLIGDVIIGPGVFVGPGASLRGDFGRLILEEGSNFQDNCVMHGFPSRDTVIAKDGHVGHGAIIHGANVGRNALVGMNAVVLDYADVGEEAMVAAGAVVRGGTIIPRRTLWAGIPAKQIKEMSDSDIAHKAQGTRDYQALAQLCRQHLSATPALSTIEQDRPRNYATAVLPKHLKNER